MVRRSYRLSKGAGGSKGLCGASKMIHRKKGVSGPRCKRKRIASSTTRSVTCGGVMIEIVRRVD